MTIHFRPTYRPTPAGARTERAIVRLLQEQGIRATKISRAWCAGADLRVPILGVDRAVEVKCCAAGFSQRYDWLKQRDVLIVKVDRQEPSVVLRISVAAEIAKGSDVIRNFPAKGNIAGRAAACIRSANFKMRLPTRPVL
jgi:hypothetical protein